MSVLCIAPFSLVKTKPGENEKLLKGFDFSFRAHSVCANLYVLRLQVKNRIAKHAVVHIQRGL